MGQTYDITDACTYSEHTLTCQVESDNRKPADDDDREAVAEGQQGQALLQHGGLQVLVSEYGNRKQSRKLIKGQTLIQRAGLQFSVVFEL